jgi:hypothetical protein
MDSVPKSPYTVYKNKQIILLVILKTGESYDLEVADRGTRADPKHYNLIEP